MNIIFMGTGTSHGVPVIGCDCPVCKSTDPRNNRTRCSCLVQVLGGNLVIDAPPEFRIQALREDLRRIDAVLFTHAHADHIFGLDDVRPFNELSGKSIRCHGNTQTLAILRQTFSYVFSPTQAGGGKPRLELVEVNGPFEAAGARIVPIPVWHGRVPVLGYRIGSFAYLTDCSRIPEESMRLLEGLHTLVLGVIRHEPHETHMTVREGLSVVEKLRPGKTLFTHITHRLDHETTNAALPEGVELAYDGLRWDVV